MLGCLPGLLEGFRRDFNAEDSRLTRSCSKVSNHGMCNTLLTFHSHFSLTTVLLLTSSSSEVEDFTTVEDHQLLESAWENLSSWNVVPFMQEPLLELERMAQLKGLSTRP